MWLADLPKLSQLSVNRCVKGAYLGEVVITEIHHFCAAFQSNHRAVYYLRQLNSDVQAQFSFLVGKSLLAPFGADKYSKIRTSSRNCVCRLNKLSSLLKNQLEIPVGKITFWTNSLTVLLYIANESKRFHTYITKRVAIIREDSSP